MNFKKLNIKSVVIEDIDTSDYPDFCDAFISYAEWDDGTPLTDSELDDASEWFDVGEMVLESLL